jgi:hypothetical protein
VTSDVFQLMECLSLTSLMIWPYDIAHEGRESNVDAHILARHCIYEYVGRHVWLLSPPYGICNSFHMSNQ